MAQRSAADDLRREAEEQRRETQRALSAHTSGITSELASVLERQRVEFTQELQRRDAEATQREAQHQREVSKVEGNAEPLPLH